MNAQILDHSNANLHPALGQQSTVAFRASERISFARNRSEGGPQHWGPQWQRCTM